MTKPVLLVRLRARLHPDERGFSLLETVIAVTVIFASLTALAYTATVGFTYGALARQKQSATGIANQTMEEIRGLAYDRIKTGLLTSDLAGDLTPTGNIAQCTESGVTVYRFLSCLPVPGGSPVGAGERIVHSGTATNPTVPLVPHVGTITKNGIPFTWKTYVTNNCPTGGTGACPDATPYRVTAIVTWTGGRSAPNKLVRVQSLFWSPAGCRSTATHPFAAPCQPFFFGRATVPQGNVQITGTVDGMAFTSAGLLSSGVESAAQQEQLSQVQGSFSQSGVTVTGGSPASAGGAQATTSVADTDPGSGDATSQRVRCPEDVLCSGGTAYYPSSTASSRFTLTAPSGETAETGSATNAAGAGFACPPFGTAESDSRPCGGGRINQPGEVTATLRLEGFVTGLGTATLARIVSSPNATTHNTSFVDRSQFPEMGLCSPASGQDGCIEQTAHRRLTSVQLGGIPSGLVGGGAACTADYTYSIAGYQDTVTAAAGVSAPAPTATIGATALTTDDGDLTYWSGAGFTTVRTTDATALPALNAISRTCSGTVGGRDVTVTITAVADSATVATTSVASSPSGAGNLTRNDVLAQSTPPKITLTYVVVEQGSTRVSLTIALNLKTLEAAGVYAAAPAPV